MSNNDPVRKTLRVLTRHFSYCCCKLFQRGQTYFYRQSPYITFYITFLTYVCEAFLGFETFSRFYVTYPVILNLRWPLIHLFHKWLRSTTGPILSAKVCLHQWLLVLQASSPTTGSSSRKNQDTRQAGPHVGGRRHPAVDNGPLWALPTRQGPRFSIRMIVWILCSD